MPFIRARACWAGPPLHPAVLPSIRVRLRTPVYVYDLMTPVLTPISFNTFNYMTDTYSRVPGFRVGNPQHLQRIAAGAAAGAPRPHHAREGRRRRQHAPIGCTG